MRHGARCMDGVCGVCGNRVLKLLLASEADEVAKFGCAKRDGNGMPCGGHMELSYARRGGETNRTTKGTRNAMRQGKRRG